MGAPKPLVEVGGTTMLARITSALRAGGCSEIVIVASPALSSGLRRAAQPGVRVTVDARPGEGPLAALADGLRAASAERCFVAACDHALLCPDCVSALVARLRPNLQAPEAVVPVSEQGFPQPLHAAYRRAAVAKLESAVGTGMRRARAVLDVLSVERVRAHDLQCDGLEHSMRSIDTPADVEDAGRLLRST